MLCWSETCVTATRGSRETPGQLTDSGLSWLDSEAELPELRRCAFYQRGALTPLPCPASAGGCGAHRQGPRCWRRGRGCGVSRKQGHSLVSTQVVVVQRMLRREETALMEVMTTVTPGHSRS